MDAEAALARYRDPLARAAEDLRSCLWNVRRGEFLQTYGVGGDPAAREARLSTLFRIAQYFAWSEILRRAVQYLSFPGRGADEVRDAGPGGDCGDEVLGDWGPSLDADLRGLASASDSDAPHTDAPNDRVHELEHRLTHLRNLLDPEGVLELCGAPPAKPA